MIVVEASSCPEVVPAVIFRSLSVPPPKNKQPHAHPQPTCHTAPQGTRGDEGTLSGDPLSAAASPAMPQDEAALWELTAKACGARKGVLGQEQLLC